MLRQAVASDIPAIRRVRHSVRENRLASAVIADDDIRRAIEDTGRGWVIESRGEVVAFAVGNANNGNIWALFVHPDHEGRGYGRRLHDAMVAWLWARGLESLWLTTQPGTRAQKFYEAAGWRQVGSTDRGELRYEARHSMHEQMRADHAGIRRAEIADAVEMARLAGELGYPMSPAEMTRRLANLLASSHHYVAVVASGDRLLAWMHVERRSSLEGGERAELMGLVVDPGARRRGFGRELVDVAENWTLAHGLTSLTVRSNTMRELSHPFYESLGYTRSKTQHVYTKAIIAPRKVSEPEPDR